MSDINILKNSAQGIFEETRELASEVYPNSQVIDIYGVFGNNSDDGIVVKYIYEAMLMNDEELSKISRRAGDFLKDYDFGGFVFEGEGFTVEVGDQLTEEQMDMAMDKSSDILLKRFLSNV